jgi:hypothetical protein
MSAVTVCIHKPIDSSDQEHTIVTFNDLLTVIISAHQHTKSDIKSCRLAQSPRISRLVFCLYNIYVRENYVFSSHIIPIFLIYDLTYNKLFI